jgi:glycosyltransferase involved in cell wall biosynthesis
MEELPGRAAGPVRVAHLSPTYFAPESVIGGGERYVHNLARALAAADTAGRFAQAVFALGAEERFFVQDGVAVRVLRNENPSPNLMEGLSGQLWREVAGFDVLHVHQALAVFGAQGCILGRALGKTVIATDLGGGAHPAMTMGAGLQLADGVVSISRYAHSLIAADFAGPAAILLGPVDTAAFAPPERRYDGPPRAICVSRILPHKGIDRVIRALPDGLELRVVGQAYDTAYRERLAQLAAGKPVTFIHDADDARVRALLHEATVFVQASTFRAEDGTAFARPELLGLAPLEALASGLPAIVSAIGPFPELAADPAYFGLFADDAALARRLQDVAAGRWPPPDAGRAAAAHVAAEHGLVAVGERLARFYDSVHAGLSATCAAPACAS